jgi:hypothetical protein
MVSPSNSNARRPAPHLVRLNVLRQPTVLGKRLEVSQTGYGVQPSESQSL